MAFNDTAKSTVILDGKQAEDALKKLQVESKELKSRMEDLRKANDLAGFTKLEKEVAANTKAQAALKKELFSVDKVMQNLSGASMNQLKTAQRSITAGLDKMTRGTQEYIDKSKQLKQVNTEIGKVKTEMQGAGGAMKSSWGAVGGMVTKFIGVASVAWWAIKSGEAVINSAQAASDKWEKATTGLSFAWDYLKKSIASWSFKDLITGMQDAAAAGREYADILDGLADRNRALATREIEIQIQAEELKRIYKDQSKTAKERADAAQQLIDLELKLSQDKTENSKIAFDAEVLRLTAMTGLKKEELMDLVRYYDKNEEVIKQAGTYGQALDVLSNTSLKKYLAILADPIHAKSISNIFNKGEEASKKFVANATDDIIKYNGLLQKYNKTSDKDLDKLVESYRNTGQATLDYYGATAKAASTLSGLQDDIIKEREAKEKKALDDAFKVIEDAYKKQKIALMNAYNNELLDKDWYDQTMIASEIAFLKMKEELYRNSGKDTLDIQQDIASKEIELNNKITDSKDKANKKKEQSDKEYFAGQAELLKQQEDDIWNQVLEEERARDAAIDNFNKQMDQYRGITDNMAASMGDALGNLIANNEASGEEFAKVMILTMLDALHMVVRMSIASIWAQSLAQPDSIMTFGATGIGRAIIISAVAEAAFAGVKAIVNASMNNNSSGGKTRQRFSGKYDVIGADDGRGYSVGYGGPMRTGIYGTPTLVAERGDEVVIDGATTRNLMVNFPHILPTIMAARVPQRADGNYSSVSTSTMQAPSDPELKALIRQQSAVIDALTSRLNKGINAKMYYTNVKEGLAKGQAAEDRGSRNP